MIVQSAVALLTSVGVELSVYILALAQTSYWTADQLQMSKHFPSMVYWLVDISSNFQNVIHYKLTCFNLLVALKLSVTWTVFISILHLDWIGRRWATKYMAAKATLTWEDIVSWRSDIFITYILAPDVELPWWSRAWNLLNELRRGYTSLIWWWCKFVYMLSRIIYFQYNKYTPINTNRVEE